MKWPAEPLRSSLRGRLTVALAIAVTILWLVGTGAAGLVLRTEIDEVFDSALQEVAQRVLPLAYSRGRQSAHCSPPQGLGRGARVHGQ
jgi:two-component system OmpR family sensor kinase